MTRTRIRILHVEDVAADAELAERELHRIGFDFEIRRVETKEAFLSALRDFRPDLILSDYRLPEFDGMQALLLAREHAPDVPVVITTGSVNEETAVECMKAGAADYVLKDHLVRLGTAVRSALDRQQLKEGRRQADEALLESEERYRLLFANSLDAVLLTTPEGEILAANAAACRMFGRSEEELLRLGRAGVANPSDPRVRAGVEERARTGAFHGEVVLLRRDQTRFTGEVSSVVFTDRNGHTRTSMVIRDVTERREAEERIRRLNRLLKTITEVDSILIKMVDEESLLYEVCRILVETGGYELAWIGRADPGTMRAVPVASAGAETGLLDSIEVRWDDSPRGRGPFGMTIRTGRHVVVRDVTADPSVLPWSAFSARLGIRSMAVLPLRRGGAVNAALVAYSMVPAFIDEEEIALLDGLAADISFALDVLDDREHVRRSEVELRKLWRAVEQTPATVVITDLEGRIEYVNPRFTEVTGYSAQEALGQNPRILKSDLTPPEVHRAMWQAITGGRVWQGELCNKRKDGTLFWEYASISPVRDEHGITTSYVAVKEDITDRRRAAEDLAKSEAYFRSLIESGRDLTAVLEPDGRLRYASPSIVRTLGYETGDLIGHSVFEFIHPEDRGKAGERLREALIEGARHEVIEVRFHHRDGSWRVLSAIGSSLPSETGMTGLIINARDITERLQLEAQFHQAQKMEAVGRLAGGVAHDFNNLLTVIRGYGDLLEPALDGDGEMHEGVVEIVKAAERASALTRQLLAFSRQQVLETRVLDVGVVVADIEKMIRRLIGEDIEVVVVKPAALGHVKADPGQIEQVLINLAVNARDAMPGGGHLELELANVDLDGPLATAHDSIAPGPYVVLSVKDTGSGMDELTLEHIFEPFFTTKRERKGTGLGLSTVYGIVRQTGGYVAVETAPGAGTTFRIYLPRCEEPRTSGIRPAFQPRNGTETVLLVEDESAVRNLTKVVLERRGYTVLEVESGAAALDVVTGDPRPIHVLLTDVILAKMNGVELAARVVALRPSIKVVYMSGYTADVLTGYDFKLGQAFLTKPFSGKALAAKMREVLDAPET